MPKIKDKNTIFCCKNCGYESNKWLGKCPSCNEWDTFTEIKQNNHKLITHMFNQRLKIHKKKDFPQVYLNLII